MKDVECPRKRYSGSSSSGGIWCNNAITVCPPAIAIGLQGGNVHVLGCVGRFESVSTFASCFGPISLQPRGHCIVTAFNEISNRSLNYFHYLKKCCSGIAFCTRRKAHLTDQRFASSMSRTPCEPFAYMGQEDERDQGRSLFRGVSQFLASFFLAPSLVG